jgi:hypothetical protein
MFNDGIFRIDHPIFGLPSLCPTQSMPEIEGQSDTADQHDGQHYEQPNENNGQKDGSGQKQACELHHWTQ